MRERRLGAAGISRRTVRAHYSTATRTISNSVDVPDAVAGIGLDVRQRRMAAARLSWRVRDVNFVDASAVQCAAAATHVGRVSNAIARNRVDVREWRMAPARVPRRGGGGNFRTIAGHDAAVRVGGL